MAEAFPDDEFPMDEGPIVAESSELHLDSEEKETESIPVGEKEFAETLSDVNAGSQSKLDTQAEQQSDSLVVDSIPGNKDVDDAKVTEPKSSATPVENVDSTPEPLYEDTKVHVSPKETFKLVEDEGFGKELVSPVEGTKDAALELVAEGAKAVKKEGPAFIGKQLRVPEERPTKEISASVAGLESNLIPSEANEKATLPEIASAPPKRSKKPGPPLPPAFAVINKKIESTKAQRKEKVEAEKKDDMALSPTVAVVNKKSYVSDDQTLKSGIAEKIREDKPAEPVAAAAPPNPEPVPAPVAKESMASVQVPMDSSSAELPPTFVPTNNESESLAVASKEELNDGFKVETPATEAKKDLEQEPDEGEETPPKGAKKPSLPLPPAFAAINNSKATHKTKPIEPKALTPPTPVPAANPSASESEVPCVEELAEASGIGAKQPASETEPRTIKKVEEPETKAVELVIEEEATAKSKTPGKERAVEPMKSAEASQVTAVVKPESHKEAVDKKPEVGMPSSVETSEVPRFKAPAEAFDIGAKQPASETEPRTIEDVQEAETNAVEPVIEGGATAKSKTPGKERAVEPMKSAEASQVSAVVKPESHKEAVDKKPEVGMPSSVETSEVPRVEAPAEAFGVGAKQPASETEPRTIDDVQEAETKAVEPVVEEGATAKSKTAGQERVAESIKSVDASQVTAVVKPESHTEAVDKKPEVGMPSSVATSEVPRFKAPAEAFGIGAKQPASETEPRMIEDVQEAETKAVEPVVEEGATAKSEIAGKERVAESIKSVEASQVSAVVKPESHKEAVDKKPEVGMPSSVETSEVPHAQEPAEAFGVGAKQPVSETEPRTIKDVLEVETKAVEPVVEEGATAKSEIAGKERVAEPMKSAEASQVSAVVKPESHKEAVDKKPEVGMPSSVETSEVPHAQEPAKEFAGAKQPVSETEPRTIKDVQEVETKAVEPVVEGGATAKSEIAGKERVAEPMKSAEASQVSAVVKPESHKEAVDKKPEVGMPSSVETSEVPHAQEPAEEFVGAKQPVSETEPRTIEDVQEAETKAVEPVVEEGATAKSEIAGKERVAESIKSVDASQVSAVVKPESHREAVDKTPEVGMPSSVESSEVPRFKEPAEAFGVGAKQPVSETEPPSKIKKVEEAETKAVELVIQEGATAKSETPGKERAAEPVKSAEASQVSAVVKAGSHKEAFDKTPEVGMPSSVETSEVSRVKEPAEASGIGAKQPASETEPPSKIKKVEKAETKAVEPVIEEGATAKSEIAGKERAAETLKSVEASQASDVVKPESYKVEVGMDVRPAAFDAKQRAEGTIKQPETKAEPTIVSASEGPVSSEGNVGGEPQLEVEAKCKDTAIDDQTEGTSACTKEVTTFPPSADAKLVEAAKGTSKELIPASSRLTTESAGTETEAENVVNVADFPNTSDAPEASEAMPSKKTVVKSETSVPKSPRKKLAIPAAFRGTADTSAEETRKEQGEAKTPRKKKLVIPAAFGNPTGKESSEKPKAFSPAGARKKLAVPLTFGGVRPTAEAEAVKELPDAEIDAPAWDAATHAGTVRSTEVKQELLLVPDASGKPQPHELDAPTVSATTAPKEAGVKIDDEESGPTSTSGPEKKPAIPAKFSEAGNEEAEKRGAEVHSTSGAAALSTDAVVEARSASSIGVKEGPVQVADPVVSETSQSHKLNTPKVFAASAPKQGGVHIDSEARVPSPVSGPKKKLVISTAFGGDGNAEAESTKVEAPAISVKDGPVAPGVDAVVQAVTVSSTGAKEEPIVSSPTHKVDVPAVFSASAPKEAGVNSESEPAKTSLASGPKKKLVIPAAFGGGDRQGEKNASPEAAAASEKSSTKKKVAIPAAFVGVDHAEAGTIKAEPLIPFPQADLTKNLAIPKAFGGDEGETTELTESEPPVSSPKAGPKKKLAIPASFEGGWFEEPDAPKASKSAQSPTPRMSDVSPTVGTEKSAAIPGASTTVSSEAVVMDTAETGIPSSPERPAGPGRKITAGPASPKKPRSKSPRRGKSSTRRPLSPKKGRIMSPEEELAQKKKELEKLKILQEIRRVDADMEEARQKKIAREAATASIEDSSKTMGDREVAESVSADVATVPRITPEATSSEEGPGRISPVPSHTEIMKTREDEKTEAPFDEVPFTEKPIVAEASEVVTETVVADKTEALGAKPAARETTGSKTDEREEKKTAASQHEEKDAAKMVEQVKKTTPICPSSESTGTKDRGGLENAELRAQTEASQDCGCVIL